MELKAKAEKIVERHWVKVKVINEGIKWKIVKMQ